LELSVPKLAVFGTQCIGSVGLLDVKCIVVFFSGWGEG